MAIDRANAYVVERARFSATLALVRHGLDTVIPSVTLIAIVCLCFGLPWLTTIPPPTGGNPLEANLALLSPGHLLGTDLNGNDNLSRLLYGGQSSLEIAVAVNLIGLVLGGLAGVLAGYVGRFVDTLIMRVLDVFIAFPSLVLVLAVAQSLGAGTWNTIWSLCFLSVPAFARIARAATLRIREQSFVAAAVISNVGVGRILARHIAPNIAPQMMTFGLLGIGVVMLIEGGLSFLGFGVRAPEPSWGNMIALGQQALSSRPSLVVLPSGLLFLTVFSCNILGQALRARWSTS